MDRDDRSRRAPGAAGQSPADDFYAAGAHRQAIAAIGRGLAQGGGLVVITGEEGSGKSMLAAYLRATLDRRRIALTELDPGAGAADLADRPRSAAAGGRVRLVLIDDAQAMPRSTLKAALRQALTHPPTLVVALVRPGGEAVLLDLAARTLTRPPIWHRLGSLLRDEVRGYLEHRLARAGRCRSFTLPEPLCAAMIAASGGNPGTLDRLCAGLFGAGINPGASGARPGYPASASPALHRSVGRRAVPSGASDLR